MLFTNWIYADTACYFGNKNFFLRLHRENCRFETFLGFLLMPPWPCSVPVWPKTAVCPFTAQSLAILCSSALPFLMGISFHSGEFRIWVIISFIDVCAGKSIPLCFKISPIAVLQCMSLLVYSVSFFFHSSKDWVWNGLPRAWSLSHWCWASFSCRYFCGFFFL